MMKFGDYCFLKLISLPACQQFFFMVYNELSWWISSDQCHQSILSENMHRQGNSNFILIPSFNPWHKMSHAPLSKTVNDNTISSNAHSSVSCKLSLQVMTLQINESMTKIHQSNIRQKTLMTTNHLWQTANCTNRYPSIFINNLSSKCNSFSCNSPSLITIQWKIQTNEHLSYDDDLSKNVWSDDHNKRKYKNNSSSFIATAIIDHVNTNTIVSITF